MILTVLQYCNLVVFHENNNVMVKHTQFYTQVTMTRLFQTKHSYFFIQKLHLSSVQVQLIHFQ